MTAADDTPVAPADVRATDELVEQVIASQEPDHPDPLMRRFQALRAEVHRPLPDTP